MHGVRLRDRVIQLYGGRIDATGTTAIGWLSSGRFGTDQRRFVFVSTLCLVLSMLILKNVLRFSAVEISLLIIFTATYYAPVLIDIQVGTQTRFSCSRSRCSSSCRPGPSRSSRAWLLARLRCSSSGAAILAAR